MVEEYSSIFKIIKIPVEAVKFSFSGQKSRQKLPSKGVKIEASSRGVPGVVRHINRKRKNH